MHRLLLNIHRVPQTYFRIFSAALFLSFHYYFITYVNSTFISGFVDESMIGYFYATSAILNILILISLPRLISKIGIFETILALSFIETIFLIFMSASFSPTLVLLSFIVQSSIPTILLACLDTTIEDSASSDRIGRTRGIFLSVLAIASVISPLIVGGMVNDGGLREVYLFSAFFMILFMLTIWFNRNNFSKSAFVDLDGLKAIKEYIRTPNIRRIGVASIVLQLFYSWMIIYVPLYLIEIIHFSWQEVGTIISISLLPFVFFEIPIGELADKKLGEKELLISGMVISSVALLLFPVIKTDNFIYWTLVILLARTGASIMETMIETYFFKKSKGRDEFISIFRMSHPIAFILGPLVGSVALIFLPFQYIFPVLSAILFIGILSVINLEDTK